jgi:transposase
VIHVGMDVHVRNSYLHVTDAEGQVLKRGRCGNSLGELGNFLDPIAVESMRVCLESTTNSRAMHQLLLKYGCEAGIDLTADVLDARKLRIIAESVTKCDKLDAQVINELSRSNLDLPTCYVPDDEEFALREHLRARTDLVRIRTMLKNRVHAVLHRRGLFAPRTGLFTLAGRTFLDRVDIDEAGRTILARYLAEIDHISRLVEESTATLRELAGRSRWAKPAALLQTMPGVGLITALTILAELGDLARFHSRAAVANYAGLVPVVRDSDGKRFRGGITHRGSSHLRGVMTEAAWMAVTRAPVYHSLFERVALRRGKAKAIVAVARRMLEDAWTILRKDEAFRYDASRPSGSMARDSQPGRKLASSVAG